MAAQRLDVGDQVLRGVVLQAAERARPPGAALVEDDDAPEVRVEEAAMHRAGAGARAAVQEQHRPAARIAHLLPVHDVAGGERQVAGLERSDLGEQVAARHGAGWYRQRGAARNRGTREAHMQRIWIGLGALAGLTAVAMAALAAHGAGLARSGRPADGAQRDRDAGLARAGPAGLRAVGAARRQAGRLGRRRVRGWASLLFCGAVYALALVGLHLPMVAPLGGSLLMLGWVLLGLSALRPVCGARRRWRLFLA